MDLLISATNGIFNLPWWGYIVLALVLTHITILSVTLYLHRFQTHRGIKIHPVISHPMRFWLWLTTGMITKEWVAIHRKHHHKVETEEDPHSPRHYGLSKVLWDGTKLYREESCNKETMRLYGQGTPNDWLERNVYTSNYIGIVLLLFVHFALFGFLGVSIWAIQMMWIPFFAAGVINGAAHAVGYRNFDTADDSTNISNIGFLVGGEELHNNHHAFPGSAKFSIKPWEFDIGWGYIKLFSFLGLAEIRNTAPASIKVAIKEQSKNNEEELHLDTIKTLFNNRLHIMSDYIKAVMQPVFTDELKKAKGEKESLYRVLKNAKHSFLSKREEAQQTNNDKKLEEVFRLSNAMQITYEYKQHLQALWKEHKNDHEKLREALLDWCHRAEQTGINALANFATHIKHIQTTS